MKQKSKLVPIFSGKGWKHVMGKLVAMSMVFSILFASTATALTSSFASTYTIGQDTHYYAVDGENGSGLQKVNYVTYQPNSGVTPIVAYGKGFYGRSTITHVANYVESLGMDVIAGINADFFDLTTGIPIGIVINDGVFISSNVGQYAVGFKENGSAVIGKPASAMKITGESGSVVIDCFNKTRSTYTVCLFDSNWSTETKTQSYGRTVIFERLDNTPVTINGSVRMKVVSNGDGAASTPIGPNQMVLSVSEKGPMDRVPNFQIGEEVTFSISTEDSNWQDVKYAVGGKVLINNKQVDTTGSPSGLAARSAIGVKADGTVVLYEVDGRQSGYSIGLTPDALAQEMLALGCVDAINLDGGGSSAMAIQMPGDTESKIVNRPSDGSPRTCANYIFLVNNKSKTGNFAHLQLYTDKKYVLKGSSVGLSVKAMDDGYYPVSAPNNVTYRIAEGDGSIDGNIYKSGSKTGQVTLTATSGNVSSSQNVFVISSVDGITVTKEGSNTKVTSLSLQAGESVKLAASATYKGMPVAVDNSSITWSVTGNVGTIKDGVFTANGSSTSGTIVASYGNYKQTINVTTSAGTPVSSNIVADFEQDAGFTPDGNAAVALNNDFTNVHNGHKALKVHYNFANADSNTLTYTGGNAAVTGGQYLYIWAKGDESGAKLTANLTNGDGDPLTAEFTPALTGGSYALLSAKMPADATALSGLTISKGSKDSGDIYLDQLLTSDHATADQTAPSIVFGSIPATVEAGKAASVTAKVTDDNGQYNLDDSNITVTIDGKQAGFTSNKTTGNISFTTGNLAAGAHRITIEAVDSFGNMTRKSADILAGTSAAQNFADISEHWAKDYINFVSDKNVLQGETVNGKTMFFPKRNLTRAEFAVIMARYLGLDTQQAVDLPYADLDKIPDWALGAVKAVYAEGIMTGSAENGKTFFHAKSNIARQEVITVIGRSLPRGYASKEQTFSDSKDIGPWAKPYVNYLVSLGIVNGYSDGTLLPKNNITRAEIAKIIYSLY